MIMLELHAKFRVAFSKQKQCLNIFCIQVVNEYEKRSYISN